MKKRYKIATLRRLVALTMLAALLFSNTAVYADTASEGEPSQEVSSETGNTENSSSATSSNSSNDSNDTVSGTVITDESNGDNTEVNGERTITLEVKSDDENNEVSDEVSEDDLDDLDDLDALDGEEAEESEEESGLFDWALALGESKHLNLGNIWCSHDYYDCHNPYYPVTGRDGQHEVHYHCSDCGADVYLEETEACEWEEPTYERATDENGKKINGKHFEVKKCKNCGAIEKKIVECTPDEEAPVEIKDDPKHECQHKVFKKCSVCKKYYHAENEDCDFQHVRYEKATDEWGNVINGKHVDVEKCSKCGAERRLEAVDCTPSEIEEEFQYELDPEHEGQHKVLKKCTVCDNYFHAADEACSYVHDRYEQVSNKESKKDKSLSDKMHVDVQKCTKCCDEKKLEPVVCSGDPVSYKSNGKTTHKVTAKCKTCDNEYHYTEACNFVKQKNEKLEYCDKPGCLNFKDARNQNPQVEVKYSLVEGKTDEDIEEFDEDGVHYIAFDKKMKIEVAVSVEALDDEEEMDMVNATAVVVYLDGTPINATYKEMVDGALIYTWTSADEYEAPVVVDKVDVSYCIREKLVDGSRSDKYTKHGDASKTLNYYLRNVNDDKEADKLTCKVTGGKDANGNRWVKDDTHVYYSKPAHNNEDLKLSFTGDTAAQVKSIELVEIIDGKEVKTEGIKALKTESTRRFLSRKYKNDIQFQVPSTDKADGTEHVYKLKFKILGKPHYKIINTYVDNTAPRIEKIDYASDAQRKHGKYYKSAVEVSVQVKDNRLDGTDNKSFINVSDEKAFLEPGAVSPSILKVNVTEDGEHVLTGEIYDIAGNCTKINDTDKKFIIDTKAPVVKDITYTSTAKRENEKYYKADVTVTVSVEDPHLNADQKKSYIEVSNVKDVKKQKAYLPEDVKSTGKFELLVSDEDEHAVSGMVYDLAGNCTKIDDTKNPFVIDKTKPTIDVKFDLNNPVTPKYYKDTRTAEITVVEKNFDAKGFDVNKNSGMYDVPTPGSFAKADDKNITKIVFDKDGHYGFTVKCTDLAGNEADAVSVEDFVIDKTAPKVTVKFDNHDFKHDKYFKADRTATVVLTDEEVFENLGAEQADINKGVTVKSKYGKPKFNSMSGAKSNYTGTIVFDEDGEYQITNVKFSDKAGNEATVTFEKSEDAAEFVIDKTNPTIEVKFDNNKFLNDIYYKDPRKAEITFEEKNFTKDQVTVRKNSGDLNSVPALEGYSDSEKTHVTSILFDQDGRYGFTITCEDLAGNMSNTYVSDDFVIDRTVPVLEISGVEDMSANNGSVKPVILSKDANMTEACTEISLTGANRGKVTPEYTRTSGTETFTFALADIAHDKNNDDLYTLAVKLTDLAGNETEKTVKYSLNRFGSIFVLSEGTKAMVDGYYVTKPQDVEITEINVDSLTKKEVSIAFDGSVRDLKEGRSFTTSDTTNSKGWHSISYTIGKSNFDKDGIYSVNIISEDRASNKQSSQAKDAEVEFLLDKTAPSVIVSGLEDGGIYEEESHDFSVNAADTIGVTDMQVYLNDEKLGSFTASELNQNGGTVVLTIPTKDDYQKVTIECSDVAGNVTKLAYNNLLVSVKAEELLLEDNLTPTAKLDDDSTAIGAMKNITALGIAGIVAAIAVVSGLGVFAFKRKKH